MKRNLLILVIAGACVITLLILGVVGLVLWMKANDQSLFDVPNPVAADPMAPADPALLSKPLDPWSIDPVPVDTMYLVMPFVNEDHLVTIDGFDFMFHLQEAMFPGMSRGMGINRNNFTKTMLRRLCEYSPDRSCLLTKEIQEDVITYMKPTHLVEGAYSEKNGEWLISMTIEEGDNHWEKDFVFPTGHHIETRIGIVTWMVECGAFPVESQLREYIGICPYGKNVFRFEGELYEAMRNDPRHDEWDRVFKEEGENPINRFYRILAATNAEDEKMANQLMPTPLDEDGYMYDFIARSVALNFLKKKSASIHEREMIMALYPGMIDQAKVYIYRTFSKGQKREAYLHSVDQWQSRVSQYPDTDLMKGDAYHSAAWDHRGNGWVSTVSGNSMGKYVQYGSIASKCYETCLSNNIPEPYVVGRLINTNEGRACGASGSSKQWHLKTAKRYPDQRETWRAMLNYSRPRWGGSDKAAMNMIDVSMTLRPKNLDFGKNAIDYHEIEAQLYSDKNDWSYFKKYCDQFPARKKQVIAGFDRLRAKEAPEHLASLAACVATMLEDSSLVHQIVTDHPDVFDSISSNTTYGNWFGQTRRRVIYSLIFLGEWERAKKALKITRKSDEYYRSKDRGEMLSFLDDRQYIDSYEALAEAMLGEKDKGIKIIEGLPPHPDCLTMIPYIRAHFNEMEKADYEALLEFQKHYPNDPDPFYIRALAALKQGWYDSALHEIKTAEMQSGKPWAAIKNEVMELLEELDLTEATN
jgi:hypothetical protein